MSFYQVDDFLMMLSPPSGFIFTYIAREQSCLPLAVSTSEHLIQSRRQTSCLGHCKPSVNQCLRPTDAFQTEQCSLLYCALLTRQFAQFATFTAASGESCAITREVMNFQLSKTEKLSRGARTRPPRVSIIAKRVKQERPYAFSFCIGIGQKGQSPLRRPMFGACFLAAHTTQRDGQTRSVVAGHRADNGHQSRDPRMPHRDIIIVD